jgi:hypothetical protein
MQIEAKVCRAYGARTMLGNRCPALLPSFQNGFG